MFAHNLPIRPAHAIKSRPAVLHPPAQGPAMVMLGASTAFMTPVSSPVNTLVGSPGNYRFGDFVRVGVPFTIIVLIVAVIMVPMLLPP